MLNKDSVIASIAELSVTPRVMRQLSVFLKNPDNDIAPAIAAMKTEAVLTTAMLAACNSPLHYRGEKLLTLEDAVFRLGFRETYRIALLVTFRQGLWLANLPDSRAADCLWSCAITAACAMEALARSPEAASTAYTIGLLHLIGCFIIARSGGPLTGFDNAHPETMLRAQEAACGMGYPEAGGIALEQWQFPPEIWQPIRFQFSPDEAGEFKELALMLSRAVTLARSIEKCRPDSALYREDEASVHVDHFTKSIEARSTELMECFYVFPPRRPAWAEQF